MFRLKFIIVGIIAALVLSLTIAAGCRKKSYADVDKISLRLKWIHQAQFAGFYCAVRQGFFEKERIKCEIRAGGQDFSAIKQVASGSDDFGVWGADQLLIARAKDIPVVALAVIYPKSPACFTTLKRSNIRTPKDFVGHSIGMQYGTDLETIYVMMLNKQGISRNEITEIPVQFNFSLLLEGKVDAWPSYAINEPILAEEKGFEVNVIQPADYGVKMYADVLFTSEDMVKNHPDLVRRVVKAVIEGWQYALNHPDTAIQDLRAYEPGIDAAHQLRMLDAAKTFVRPTANWKLGTMDMAVWQEMEQALLSQKLLSKPVDLSALVQSQFVDSLYDSNIK